MNVHILLKLLLSGIFGIAFLTGCTSMEQSAQPVNEKLMKASPTSSEFPIKHLNSEPIVVQGKQLSATEDATKVLAKPSIFMLSIGERDIWTTQLFQPRQYCGADPQAYTASVCGTRVGHLYHVGVQGGHQCGYNYYVIICIN
jgi:hypothetical protein